MNADSSIRAASSTGSTVGTLTVANPIITASDNASYLLLANGSYQAYFKNDSKTSKAVELQNQGYTFDMDISTSQLHWYNSSLDAIIGMVQEMNPQDTSATTSGYNVTYAGAWINTDLWYQALPETLKETLIIHAVSSPSSSIKPDYLQYVANCYYNNSLTIYANGIAYLHPTNQKFVTNGTINFCDMSNATIFYLPLPYINDSLGTRVMGFYAVTANNGILIINIRIPKTFIDSATFPIYFDPSTVCGTTDTLGVSYPFQRKTFYANGLHWAFFCNGTYITYCTSSDGTTWTNGSTTIKACITGYYFSTYFNGTYFHYVYSKASSLYYRRGTPNANGTITWSDGEQTVATTYSKADSPSIATDSSGYVWIGYRDTGGSLPIPDSIASSKWYPYVIKSGWNNGTWGTTATGFPYQLSATSGAGWMVNVVPLSSARMYVLYNMGPGFTIKGNLWTGSWGGEEIASTSTIYSNYGFSAVADSSDNVYLVFLNLTALNINSAKRTYGTGWGSTVTVKSGLTTTSLPVLNIASAELYCFWATKTTNSPTGATANHVYYQTSTDGGATWAAMTDWLDESVNTLNGADKLTCSYQNYTGKIGFEYLTLTASPYNVRYAFLSTTAADTTPPTYYSISTNTTLRNSACSFNCNWTDETALSGYIFGCDNCSGSGAFTNLSWASLTGTTSWANVTSITLNATVGTVISYEWWCNDTASGGGNWNNTGIQKITTISYTPAVAITLSSSNSISDTVLWTAKLATTEGTSTSITSSENTQAHIAISEGSTSGLSSSEKVQAGISPTATGMISLTASIVVAYHFASTETSSTSLSTSIKVTQNISLTQTGTIVLATSITVQYHAMSSETIATGLFASVKVTQNIASTETGTISLTASVTVGYNVATSETTSENLNISLNGAAENISPDITGIVAFDTSIQVDYHMNTVETSTLSLNIATSEILNASSLISGSITLDTSIQVGYSLATQTAESSTLTMALTEVELLNNSLAVNTTGILTLNMAAQVSCHLATTATEIVDVVQSATAGYHVTLSQSENTGLASTEQANYNMPEILSVSNTLQTIASRGQKLVELFPVLITLGTFYLHLPLGLANVAVTTLEYGSIIAAIGTAVIGALRRRRKLK